MLGDLARLAAALALPAPLAALGRAAPQGAPVPDRHDAGGLGDADRDRLLRWSAALRADGLAGPGTPLGRAAARVGELAIGTPYEAHALEAYLRAGVSGTEDEPLTLSLTRFDCVTLVESCLAVARVARDGGDPSWERFARAVERMRYRGGVRGGYASRLHYFSEWITDGERRGLLRDLGDELGAERDARPLGFMTEHHESYVALADERVFRSIAEVERRLDGVPRRVIPTARIPEVADRIRTGDVLAFATAIPGLDVTHAAFAHRGDDGVLRVLHAPLSGGTVEVTGTALPEYVARIRRSTGILVARPS